MKLSVHVIALLVLCSLVKAEVKTEVVSYADGDQKLVGFLAYDDAHKDKRAGVLVVPEWWGLNDYVKMRAQKLAGEGYVAFVADIYGDGFNTTDPKIAGERATAAASSGKRLARSKIAMELLRKNDHVDASRLAAIGYCFGGSAVLDLARAGEDLRCIVSFHGALKPTVTEKPGDIKAKVLVCHGADDKFISDEEFSNFVKEMNTAKADWLLVQYSGAVHAFTNPDAGKFGIPGVQYNENADKRSWAHMKVMFDEALKAPEPSNLLRSRD